MMIRLSTAVLACSLFADGESFVLKPTETARLELTVEKTGLMSGKKHLFVFDRWSGTLQFIPGKPQEAVVSLTIQANSIRCLDTWVSAKDLRKIEETALKDMLAAERYPQITFRSESISQTKDADYQMQGRLTIRDLAKPVTVSVTMEPGAAESLRFLGKASIRLSDYGLKPPSAILGAIGTKNEMTLGFALVATPMRD